MNCLSSLLSSRHADNPTSYLHVVGGAPQKWAFLYAFDWGDYDSEEILLQCNANKLNIYPLTTGGDYIDRAFDWGGNDSEEILLQCNANKSNINWMRNECPLRSM
jgi:hypothetical protein